MNTDYNTDYNITDMRLKKLTAQQIQLGQARLVDYQAGNPMIKGSTISNAMVDRNAQSGFTLIELMISLVLGLLIAAAAMQVYIINFKTTTVQQSTSDLVDASVFGIQLLESHIRMANMGSDVREINDNAIGGGIVLTGMNLGKYKIDETTNQKVSDYANMGYLTRSAGDTDKTGTNGWTGVSNMSVDSDQLTIQFKNVTGVAIPDCEGKDIQPVELDKDGKPVKDAEIAIERFFLRKSSTTAAADDLVLACDAGRITVETTTDKKTGVEIKTYTLSDLGGAGQPFILGVDQFKVLLGVQATESLNIKGVANPVKTGQMMYLPSHTYNGMEDKDAKVTLVKPPIVSVKLGMVIHGSTAILGSDDQTEFKVLGEANTLTPDAKRKKHMRTTYETSVLLRNARVVDLRKTYKACYQPLEDGKPKPGTECK